METTNSELPFRKRDPSMPGNLSMACRRLAGLKVRLIREKDLMRHVKEMEELVKQGYTERVLQKGTLTSKIWYLPHHPVLNPNKPENTHIVLSLSLTVLPHSRESP